MLNNPIKALILSACLLLFVTINPSQGVNVGPKPFVAVFVTPEFEMLWHSEWSPAMAHHEPNKIFAAKHGWTDFDKFCKDTVKEAKGRPIVLDLDVHGEDHGLAVKLGKPDEAHTWSITTVGYVMHTIEEDIGSDNLTVLLEACYSGNAYYYTIRGSSNPVLNCEDIPPFPVYGVGSGFSNWGATVYLQYVYGSEGYFEDLRDYELITPRIHEKEDPNNDDMSVTLLKLKAIYERLSERKD